MSGFTGFGSDTSKFLRALGRNNNKGWFTKSKKFAAYCAREWKKLLPLHRWLVDEVRG